MADQENREFMQSIFLMEAWETVAVIEEGLGRLRQPDDSGDASVEPLAVVIHRLKGAAALYGFPRLAGLADGIEKLFERVGLGSLDERRHLADFLGDVAICLGRALDKITATGSEDADEIAAFEARHPALFSSPADPADVAEPAPAAFTWEPTAEHFSEEVERFFSENADVLEYFGPEAAEHLEAMTSCLLALEQNGRSEEDLDHLFRAVHTLKGAAYTVGFRVLGDLGHQIEDLLVAVRENRLPLTNAVIEAVFAGADATRLLLASAGGAPAELPVVMARALSALRALAPPDLETAESQEEVDQPGAAAVLSSAATERDVAMEIARAIGRGHPPNGDSVVEDLNVLLSTPDLARTAEEQEGEEPAPAGTALSRTGAPELGQPGLPRETREAGRKEREKGKGELRSTIRVNLDRLDSIMNLVGELVIARSRLDRRLHQLDRVGEQLLFTRSRMAQAVRDFEGKHEYSQLPTGTSPQASAPAEASTPEVGENRLLSEVFAELEFDRYDDFNILARRVAEISADLGEVQSQTTELIRAIWEETSSIQRLTGGLRGEITRARMVPIGQLFARFARQVRQAARAAGKTVGLEVSGETVELDNTIIEQVADPILHLVQNAISHGIEPEDERRTRGKPPHGTIYLSAYHQGGSIYVEVKDDGRGIDAGLVKSRAVALGFVTEEAASHLSEAEALNLIFLPGLSTASSVTTASGRGVGMDVVRTNISRLNGEIEVETEVGVGTRFSMRLPLTMAISEALMVRAGGETLGLPLTAIRLILMARPEHIQSVGRAEMIQVGDQLLDLIRLDRALGLPPAEARSKVPVVVLRSGGKSFAIAVDELLGKEEIVIKSLGKFMEGVGPFAGATISGEGRVVLLLDPMHLTESGDGVSRVAVVAPAGHARETDTTSGRRAPDAARRVMLVDDSLSIRKFVGQMLEKNGFQVIAARDGGEALQLLGETSVDVVVTDLEMPKVNGYELVEGLRRNPSTRDLPVVVLTSRASNKHMSLARSLGVKDYVTKPVDEQAFIRLIASVTSSAITVAELSSSGT